MIRWTECFIEWSWDWMREPRSTQETEEWENLFGILGSSRGSGKEDSWKWLGDDSGSFSVASVRGRLHEDLETSNNYVMKWSKWIPSKCSIFMWRAEMNRLPTLDTLKRRNIQVDSSTCIICGTNEETVEHILIGCRVANVVWSFVSSWSKVPPIFGISVRDLMELHNHVNLSAIKKSALQVLLLWQVGVYGKLGTN
ncbi:putative reverse transcriptase zinc-binding domain-containing protein [Helianthus debilis subsp. tardiflorus]